MGSISKYIIQVGSEDDIIDDKLEEVDVWLLHLDNSRKSKAIPRALYEKIKTYIESSLVLDFRKIASDNYFFYHLKPTLRNEVVQQIFEPFINNF